MLIFRWAGILRREMRHMNKTNAMRVRLTADRKADILRKLTSLYGDEFDEKLSPFRADQILTFFLQHLGPAVYNQAIQDARKFMSERLLGLGHWACSREVGNHGCSNRIMGEDKSFRGGAYESHIEEHARNRRECGGGG